MIVKKTKQLGNFKKGINLYVPRRRSSSAPSGIPVASTASVTVAGFTGGNTTYNGTYTKKTSGGFDPSITTPPTDGEFYERGVDSIVLLPPSVTIGGYNSFDGDDYSYSFAPQGNWTISIINDDSGGATSLIVLASNASSNNNYIPTTGWSPSITITGFPNVALTSIVNVLINNTNAETTSYLQSLGFSAVNGIFTIPLQKQIPPTQNFYTVEYRTTFADGAECYLVHSSGANNRWFIIMTRFTYYDEEFGNQYSVLISGQTAEGQSNSQIIATRSSYIAGTNTTNLVSPNCFS